jgi:hypothetical protein
LLTSKVPQIAIDVATWPELTDDERDEIAAVLDSMTFESADR